MNTSNIIVLIILIVILIPAVKSTVSRLQGKKNCCGGPAEQRPSKKIKGTPKETLNLEIEGMQCVNCRNRIEKHLDALEGVVAKVDLEKKTATVELYRDVDHELIRQTIEDLDFTVVSMK